MEKITQAWEYFNGKKMIIGGAILALSFFALQINTEVVIGIWNITTPDWFYKTVQTVQWIGASLTGVGAVHKMVK